MASPVSGHLIQLKHRKPCDFSLFPNSIFRDRKLDWGPLGLLLDLLHLHPASKISLEWLCTRRSSRRHATRALVAKLRAQGYLLCERVRDRAGKIAVHRWTVSDAPIDEWRTKFARCGGGKFQSKPEPDRLRLNRCARDPEFDFLTVEKVNGGKSASKELKTLKKLKTTTQATRLDLSALGALAEKHRVVVAELVGELPPAKGQDVLDELAGAIGSSNPPLRPISWVRGVIRNAKAGDFDLDAGVPIAAARNRRQAMEADAAVRRREAERRADPEVRKREKTAADAALAKMAAQFKT